MDFAGINRKITPIGGPMGISYYQQNTRMRVDKEIQRRLGMCSTNLPPASAAIIGLAPAYTANGPIVVTMTLADVIGAANPLPMWRELYLVKPHGDPLTCTLWGPFNDSGTTGAAGGHNPPVGSCQGTVTFTATEFGGGRSGGGGSDYGYSVVVTANGVPILTTGCLVNSGAFGSIPLGTTVLAYTVTGGCSGGSVPGTWSLDFTSP
jgi:hypothetical protein